MTGYTVIELIFLPFNEARKIIEKVLNKSMPLSTSSMDSVRLFNAILKIKKKYSQSFEKKAYFNCTMMHRISNSNPANPNATVVCRN